MGKNNIRRRNYIFLFLMLILLCLFAGCKRTNTATVTNRTGSAIKTSKDKKKEAMDDLKIIEDKDLYIVEEIDMEAEKLTLYSLKSDRQQRYSYNMTTSFQDKFGGKCSCVNFPSGTVVEIGDKLPSSGALSSVKKTDGVWVYEDVSNFKIDAEINLFATGGSNYKITDKTKLYSDGMRISADQIGENDVLTVTGIDKEIISIFITSGHGYVQLSNTELFEDSLIFIGDKIVTKIVGDDIIEVPEGDYTVTVANDGWGGSGDYSVLRGDTTIINLDDLKGEGPSYCDVTFEVVVPDTYVFLDGKIIDTDEVQSVRYGTHKLVVQCNGYVSWDKTLVVNSQSATITLVLEQDVGNSTTNQQETSTEDHPDGEHTETSDESEETSNSTEVENNSPGSFTPKSPADNNAGSNTIDNSASEDGKYDYEKDYLSTISNMLNTLAN